MGVVGGVHPEVVYDADSYLRLVNTFSGHMAIRASHREHRYSEIRRRLAARTDGLLHRRWGAVLQVARRISEFHVPNPIALRAHGRPE